MLSLVRCILGVAECCIEQKCLNTIIESPLQNHTRGLKQEILQRNVRTEPISHGMFSNIENFVLRNYFA